MTKSKIKMKRRGNNEGSIQQLPSGSWRAQIAIGGQRKSASFKTKREAEAWSRQMARQVDEGFNPDNSKATLEEYVRGWLTSSKPSLAPRTWSHYEQLSRTHILPALGKYRLSDLSPERVQKAYDRLISQGVGLATVRKIHNFLHNVLGRALKIGLIQRNPADAVMPPRKPYKEMQILDEEQVNTLLICASGSKLEALLRLAISTGMREMELLGLKWSDLNPTRRMLKIERQLSRSNAEGDIFAPLKTRSSRRTVQIGEQLVQSLHLHREHQQAEKAAAGESWREHDLIFPTSLGTPMHPRNLLRDFKRLLRMAGLPEIRFHDLRHTAASLMLINNVPVITVSKRLGHANTSITLNTYSHWVPGMQDAAVEVMDRITTPISIDPAMSTSRVGAAPVRSG